MAAARCGNLVRASCLRWRGVSSLSFISWGNRCHAIFVHPPKDPAGNQIGANSIRGVPRSASGTGDDDQVGEARNQGGQDRDGSYSGGGSPEQTGQEGRRNQGHGCAPQKQRQCDRQAGKTTPGWAARTERETNATSVRADRSMNRASVEIHSSTGTTRTRTGKRPGRPRPHVDPPQDEPPHTGRGEPRRGNHRLRQNGCDGSGGRASKRERGMQHRNRIRPWLSVNNQLRAKCESLHSLAGWRYLNCRSRLQNT